MVWTDEASDWPSGTSEGVASWDPVTHQHYLKTTQINKDLQLCQTPLHILSAFNWNGNTLPSLLPLPKKNDRQAACTFCSCVRGNNASFMKGSGTFLKSQRAGFPGPILIVVPSCLVLPLEKKTLLRTDHLKLCHSFIWTSVSHHILWFDKQQCHPILIKHSGSASKQFI